MTGVKVTPKLIEIQRVVARNNGITVEDIKSDCRKRAFAWPRQIAVHLSRRLTICSYPEIARAFCYLDHTAGIHAFRKVEAMRWDRPDLQATLDSYIAEIQADANERFEASLAVRITPAPPLAVNEVYAIKRKWARGQSPDVVEANLSMRGEGVMA